MGIFSDFLFSLVIVFVENFEIFSSAWRARRRLTRYGGKKKKNFNILKYKGISFLRTPMVRSYDIQTITRQKNIYCLKLK